MSFNISAAHKVSLTFSVQTGSSNWIYLQPSLTTSYNSSIIALAYALAKDLSSIFKFIEQLNELKTDNTKPLSSILNEPLRTRKDEINDGKIREKVLENSPQKNEEFFVVPKVIE